LPMRCTVPSTLPAVAGSICVIGPWAAGELLVLAPVPAPVSERLHPPLSSNAPQSDRHPSRGNGRVSNGMAILSDET
jgi:hypothetical protein